MNKLYRKGTPILPKLIYLFNRSIYACDIRPNKGIAPSVVFPHNALGVVVHHNSQIGENTKILQNVTIGGNMGKERTINNILIDSPSIGANVLIGVGAIIIGPVVIGDNSIIGAGSIITKDVPANAVVYTETKNIMKGF